MTVKSSHLKGRSPLDSGSDFGACALLTEVTILRGFPGGRTRDGGSVLDSFNERLGNKISHRHMRERIPWCLLNRRRLGLNRRSLINHGNVGHNYLSESILAVVF